jgi:hypothetical protein
MQVLKVALDGLVLKIWVWRVRDSWIVWCVVERRDDGVWINAMGS